MSTDGELAPAIQPILRPGESLAVAARATNAIVALTDQRILVKVDQRVRLDVPIEGVRRIQFDLERKRPATFTIVPDDPRHEPQVLAIPFEEVAQIADVIAALSDHFEGGD